MATNDSDRFTYHKGDTVMKVNGVKGKFVSGKFVPEEKKETKSQSTKRKTVCSYNDQCK